MRYRRCGVVDLTDQILFSRRGIQAGKQRNAFQGRRRIVAIRVREIPAPAAPTGQRGSFEGIGGAGTRSEHSGENSRAVGEEFRRDAVTELPGGRREPTQKVDRLKDT